MPQDSFKKGLDDLEAGPPPPAPETSANTFSENLPSHPSVDALRQRFGDAVLRHELAAGDEHIVYIPAEQSHEILAWLRDDPTQRYDYLADLTAIDYGHGMFLQVVYQLWSMEHKRQLRLKVELPMDSLEIESAYYLWRAADWLEREVYDMFGIVFRNHPDLRRILMPYNYAEGHPLRKDFPLRGRFTRAEQTRRSLSMKTEDHYSPSELELARRLGQPLPDVMVEGGPGVPEPGMMPGIGGAGGAT
jgi:NADH-quinone oxidoreductase subunit C